MIESPQNEYRLPYRKDKNQELVVVFEDVTTNEQGEVILECDGVSELRVLSMLVERIKVQNEKFPNQYRTIAVKRLESAYTMLEKGLSNE